MVPQVSISENKSVAVEGEASAQAPQLTFTRTGSTTQALTVKYSVAGSATPGTDYNSPSVSSCSTVASVTIPAGQSSVSVPVTALADSVVEGTESLSVSLVADLAYRLSLPASASIAIRDSVNLTSEVVSDFLPSETVIYSSVTSTFRVSLYAADSGGQQVAATGVTAQSYTFDAGAGATISQVIDSRGLSWTLNGSTANFSQSGSYAGTSFNVTIVASYATAGNKEITLEGSVQVTGTGGAVTVPMRSSSEGRAIMPAAAPGPVVTPSMIYHINDSAAVAGKGHSAVIIPNGNGCTYYSFAANGEVKVMAYNNIDDALACAKAAGYTREEHWNCNAANATNARAAAMAFDNTPYNATLYNCWNMVFHALEAAGTNAIDAGSIPNVNFSQNVNNARGWSNL